MMSESVSKRIRLAEKIVSVKQKVAQAVTDDFFLNHSELAVRYGAKGRQFCTADACFHVEFLAGAIEADSPQAFADYARWTARMLGARGIGAHTLEENLGQLEKHLAAVLLAEEHDAVLTFMTQGRKACTEPELAPDLQPSDNRMELTRQVFLAAGWPIFARSSQMWGLLFRANTKPPICEVPQAGDRFQRWVFEGW